MKWLRSIVTFNLIIWLGILLLGSISAFLLQARFRIDQIFTNGLNPFPDCGCTLVTFWSSNAWWNGAVIGLSIFGAAVLIWSAISFFRVLFTTMRFNRWVRSLRIESLHDTYSIDVIASDDPLIFCYGLLQHRIAVSERIVNSLSIAELTTMLKHELHHQRSADPLKLFVVQWFEQTFFFIPGFKDLAQLFRLAMEMEADEAIDKPDDMRRALISHIGLQLNRFIPSNTTQPAAFFSVTEARLNILVGKTPKIRDRKLVWGLIIPIALMSVFIFFAQSSDVFAKEYLVRGASCEQVQQSPHTVIERGGTCKVQMSTPVCAESHVQEMK